ncbi:hypothetical protein QJS66_01055 [Kocuria rhizophila]|nr:hypothetical protein QJS66_01055 [Kocuria rhizophila]
MGERAGVAVFARSPAPPRSSTSPRVIREGRPGRCGLRTLQALRRGDRGHPPGAWASTRH